MQRWRRDGGDVEGDVAVKRLPLVLQLELTPTRDRCHGRGTMIVRKVFSLASLGRDLLLAEMEVCRNRPSSQVEVDYHRTGG